MSWQSVSTIISEQAEGYEFYGDNGTHTPTEAERILLVDFVHGLLADEEFLDAIDAALKVRRQVTSSRSGAKI